MKANLVACLLCNKKTSDNIRRENKPMHPLKPLLILLLILTASLRCPVSDPSSKIISYIADPRIDQIQLYWKDDQGKILGSISNLKSYVESKKSHLVFAMNGGMYRADHSPLGLFIQEGVVLSTINTDSGKGNFYIRPNGVFYITSGHEAIICPTEDFANNGKVKYATQSGPMLIYNGEINSAFKKGSENLNVRNGVGILPDGRVILAMSKEKINFYDFALFFKNLGCRNALYLDGFVSRSYAPQQGWEQTDGDFGVMIGVTSPL